jgi:hypothetical protein
MNGVLATPPLPNAGSRSPAPAKPEIKVNKKQRHEEMNVFIAGRFVARNPEIN